MSLRSTLQPLAAYLSLLVTVPQSLAQGPGSLDTLFTAEVYGTYPIVQATAVLPDGRMIIVGDFTQVGFTTRVRIARLNADGSVDTSFTASANNNVNSVVVQADGKILLGGSFTSVNNSVLSATTGVNYIARLNADGTRDMAFNTSGGSGLGGANSYVSCLALQPDGKILLGGAFTSVNNSVVSATTGVNYIARLNADGTRDMAFNTSGGSGQGGANSGVTSLALQADGKILLGGNFTSVNGSALSATTGVNRIARLNTDGTLDTAFNTSSGMGLGGANGYVGSVVVKADGKILIGGDFNSVNGSVVDATAGVNRITQLNADGTRDTAFNSSGGIGLGGVNGVVSSLAAQADGKILLGGFFTSVNGSVVSTTTGVNRIARLNADGTRDTTFNSSGGVGLGGANNSVYCLALQADGRILLGGGFTSVNGTARNSLARLTNDAASQSLSAPNTTQVLWSRSGAGSDIFAVSFEQSTDGEMTWTNLGAGSRLGSTSDWKLTGLTLPSAVSIRVRGRTTSGSASGSSGLIEQVTAFTGLTTPATSVVRNTTEHFSNNTTLTITGTGFSTTPGENTVAFSPAGTGIAMASTATSLTVTGLSGLATGALNVVVTTNGHNSGAAVQVATVIPPLTVAQSTAAYFNNATTLIITGTGFSTTPGNNTVVFSPTVTGTVTDSTATTLTVTGLSGLMLGAINAVITTNGQNSGAAVQVATIIAPPAGYLDMPVNAAVTGDSGVSYVLATAVLPDEKMIIGGYFTAVGGEAHANIARLNADGSVDASFNASTNSSVNSVVVQADGKILLGGDFTSVNGSAVSSTTGVNNITRLNADGTRDMTFNSSGGVGLGGANNSVYCLTLQADGKILLGGFFTSVNGSVVSTTTGVNRIARLNADGTRDTTFNSSGGVGLGGANNSVYCLALQADGHILLGGDFTSVNGSAASSTTGVNRIARLNADGTRDLTFNTSGGTGLGGANSTVYGVAVQADGKVLFCGHFNRVNGSVISGTTGVNKIARLNADGTRDTAFNTSGGIGLGGANSGVLSLALQADGKILLSGDFTSVNGSAVNMTTGVNSVARLNADGTRDTAFNTSGGIGLGGANSYIYSVAVQADGRLLVGGYFTSINGMSRIRFARLYNDATTQNLSAADTSRVLWSRSGAGPGLSAVSFEQSTDGGTTWTVLGSGTRVGSTANWQLTGLSLPSTVSVRARGRTGGGGGSFGLIEQIAAFTGLTTAIQSWRQSFFGSTANSGDSADGADPDGDGMVNLLEYTTGQSPATNKSLNASVTLNGGTVEFIYPRSVAAMSAGAGLTVEWSDVLPGASPWSTNGVSEVVISTSNGVEQVKATLPVGNTGRRFARLRSTPPP